MADVNPTKAIITLDMDGLSISIKRQRLLDLKKKKRKKSRIQLKGA